MAQNGTRASGPRCIALVGPFQSGKTTLLEAILARTGAIQRQGTIEAGTTVGDASKEARHHKMSVELSVATTDFMGDAYTLRRLSRARSNSSTTCARRCPQSTPRSWSASSTRRKCRSSSSSCASSKSRRFRASCSSTRSTRPTPPSTTCSSVLQPASRNKLLLRQIPTFSGDLITGFVDLALERAFVYKEHAPSEVIPLEGDVLDREKTARFSMLETLADHDDELMEQLLEDIQPPRDKVFDDLAKELREGLVCPVLFGSATRTNGVLRLMKALRHESPGIADTAKRLGVKAGSDPVAYVMKTHQHRARRQDVGGARAHRQDRRRHDPAAPERRGRTRRRRCSS